MKQAYIGEGGFGVVYQGVYKDLKLAIKRQKSQLNSNQIDKLLKQFNEVSIGVNHDNQSNKCS
jgi:serine/threonine protein kinase